MGVILCILHLQIMGKNTRNTVIGMSLLVYKLNACMNVFFCTTMNVQFGLITISTK